jgi:hypothetical protein
MIRGAIIAVDTSGAVLDVPIRALRHASEEIIGGVCFSHRSPFPLPRSAHFCNAFTPAVANLPYQFQSGIWGFLNTNRNFGCSLAVSKAK